MDLEGIPTDHLVFLWAGQTGALKKRGEGEVQYMPRASVIRKLAASLQLQPSYWLRRQGKRGMEWGREREVLGAVQSSTFAK